MKQLSYIFIFVFMSLSTEWQTDFASACRLASEQHRLVLLNFSGSDWCIPCIRMRKELFDNKEFLQMADTTLVMYNADFPRNKKNTLGKVLMSQNEALADKYNKDGKFPYTLLLNAEGKVLKVWDGYPNQTPRQFAEQLKNLSDANTK